MIEIVVKVVAEDLSAAINRLAQAMACKCSGTQESKSPAAQPAAPMPQTVQPVAPQPAPMPQTVQPAPMPQITPPAEPTAPATCIVQPQTAIVPQPVQAQPQITPPVQAAQPAYTIEQLSRAAADLATTSQGNLTKIQAIFRGYGITTMTELKPDMYAAFAQQLRELGAKI